MFKFFLLTLVRREIIRSKYNITLLEKFDEVTVYLFAFKLISKILQ